MNNHSASPARPARPPAVLCVSGLDPSGGAGLQADIETLAAHGVHALGLVSALTVQDSRDVRRVEPVAVELLEAQLDVLLADRRPDAIKLGLLADAAQLAMLGRRLAELPGVPVVCDPVLRAGGGTELVDAAYPAALRRLLLPWVTVLTPNVRELRRLVPEAADLDAAAAVLRREGAASVLVTGGDEPEVDVINLEFDADGRRAHRWPRLPETFHGAGCTLASAIAARLALGATTTGAIAGAQGWTQAALAAAVAIGHGRRIPGRVTHGAAQPL